MTNIYVASSYTSKFAELWEQSLKDLIIEGVEGVFANGEVEKEEIEAVYIANMGSGMMQNQLHLNALVSQLFSHLPPAVRIEGACASGSLALITAEDALKSGKYQTVLVLGVEKMTDLATNEVTKVLTSASDVSDEYGATFPALYALLAQRYIDKYGLTREQLSSVVVKNHHQAMNNPKAQFHKEFSLEQVSNSMMIASPLRLLDSSPISDGVSAVVLSTKKRSQQAVMIVGAGQGQDFLSLAQRKSLTSLSATKKAVEQALKMANFRRKLKISINDIKVAEVHDCFSIAEILAVEDLGFFPKGTTGKASLLGQTSVNGKVWINPSGGLKACGHPIGATGVKQVAYLANLLRTANNKYHFALAHNVGGTGATVVVHILEKL